MLQSILRTTVLYFALIVSIRLMGKRQVGQMEPSELVVTMLVADLATIPVAEPDMPITAGLLPIAVIVVVELIVSLLCDSSMVLRKLLCGRPVILIENGHILQKNLRRNRITPDELTGHLRLKDVLDLSTVQYAILETNGDLSVFLYPAQQTVTMKAAGIQTKKQQLPVTIIENGKLLKKNLPIAKKDSAWVEKVLRSHEATVDTTFLLTVDASDHILWLPIEHRP